MQKVEIHSEKETSSKVDNYAQLELAPNPKAILLDLIGPNLVERIHAPHTERGGRSSLRQGVRGCKVTVNQLKDTIAEMFVEA